MVSKNIEISNKELLQIFEKWISEMPAYWRNNITPHKFATMNDVSLESAEELFLELIKSKKLKAKINLRCPSCKEENTIDFNKKEEMHLCEECDNEFLPIEYITAGEVLYIVEQKNFIFKKDKPKRVSQVERLLKEERKENKEVIYLSDKIKGDKKEKVFIVHGHDNEVKYEVQLLLQRAGLDGIVLNECCDENRTIIDKLMQESEEACYAICLVTPDDITEDGEFRARQNVILEIGYFLGKLGRRRVRILKKGDIEIPSDLKGVLYGNYDDTSWQIKLLKEIRGVGIPVDLESVIDRF